MACSSGRIEEFYNKIKVNINCIENVLLAEKKASQEVALLLLNAWKSLAGLQTSEKEIKGERILKLTKDDLSFCDDETLSQIVEMQHAVTESTEIEYNTLIDNLDRFKKCFEDALCLSAEKGEYCYWTKPMKIVSLVVGIFILILCLMPIVEGIFMPSLWRVSYYANPNLTGEADFVAYEHAISLNKRAKLKKMVGYVNSFSVRFDSCLRLPEQKDFNFTIASDDGSRLKINDQLVIDNWGAHPLMSKNGHITLPKGISKITVEYNDYGGGATLNFDTKDFEQYLEVPSGTGACL